VGRRRAVEEAEEPLTLAFPDGEGAGLKY